MFIYSGKSRYCNCTFFVLFAIYITTSIEYLNRMQIIFSCLESTFHHLCYLKVLFKLVNREVKSRFMTSLTEAKMSDNGRLWAPGLIIATAVYILSIYKLIFIAAVESFKVNNKM